MITDIPLSLKATLVDEEGVSYRALYRSFLPLAAAAAAFDFTTRHVRDTSQVVVLARAGKHEGPTGCPSPADR